MSDHIEVADSLSHEKALTLAAVASTAWCARSANGALSRRLIEQLMLAASWVSRARRDAGLGPMSVSDLVLALEQPVERWLPGCHSFALVEDGQPTLECQDLADDAGPAPLSEVEQNVIKAAIAHFAGQKDGAEAYARFRRFLVENAYSSRTMAAEAVARAGIGLGYVYQRIPANAVLRQGKEPTFYPCPRCRWPMSIRGERLACRATSCLVAGARFDLSDGHLVGLGEMVPPPPIQEAGMICLHAGIWRFTVLPGLEELALAKRLGSIGGVTVQLWPFIDAYDLDVRRGDHHWRVDVKDHRVAMTLARHLNSRPSAELTWIVVPDVKRDQVPVLSQHVARDAGYHFVCSSELVRRVGATS